MKFKNFFVFCFLFIFLGFISFIYKIDETEAATPTITSAVLQDYDEELELFTIEVTGTNFYNFFDSEVTGEAIGESLVLIRLSGGLNPTQALINNESEITLTFSGYGPITETNGKNLTIGAGIIMDEEGDFNEEVTLSGENLIDNAQPALLQILPFNTEGFYDIFLSPMNDFYALQINFSENLDEDSKEAIEEALIEGASSPITFRWNPEDDGYRRLRVRSNEITVFLEDVDVEVSDLLNNSGNIKIIDSSEGNGITAEALSDGTENYSLPPCSFEEQCEFGMYASVINFSGSILNDDEEDPSPVDGLSLIQEVLAAKASGELFFVWESDNSILKIFADEPVTFTSDVWAYVFPDILELEEGDTPMHNIERILLVDKDSKIVKNKPIRRSSGSTSNNSILLQDNEGCLPGYKFNVLNGQMCSSNNNIDNNIKKENYAFGETLVREGTKGEACRAWQMFLNDKLNAGLVVDGWCGKITMTKAKLWQASVGLMPDGLLGPMSRGKANTQ